MTRINAIVYVECIRFVTIAPQAVERPFQSCRSRTTSSVTISSFVILLLPAPTSPTSGLIHLYHMDRRVMDVVFLKYNRKLVRWHKFTPPGLEAYVGVMNHTEPSEVGNCPKGWSPSAGFPVVLSPAFLKTTEDMSIIRLVVRRMIPQPIFFSRRTQTPGLTQPAGTFTWRVQGCNF